jgi:hypothetical protein
VPELKHQTGRTLELVSSQVGFRKVEIKDGVFLVKGQPVKLKGVNRHENFPDTGHAVTRAQMELDLLRLKQANVNHVRTSHYPNIPTAYLCNKYGILSSTRRISVARFTTARVLSHRRRGGGARGSRDGDGRARQESSASLSVASATRPA